MLPMQHRLAAHWWLACLAVVLVCVGFEPGILFKVSLLHLAAVCTSSDFLLLLLLSSCCCDPAAALSCRAPFPDVPKGLACDVNATIKGDTWVNAAARLKVNVNELQRSNPSLTAAANGALPVGKKLFLPPCIDGWLEGTKVPGTRAAAVMRVPRP
jgi:hypothetical protein